MENTVAFVVPNVVDVDDVVAVNKEGLIGLSVIVPGEPLESLSQD